MFATINDLIKRWRPLTAEEMEQAGSLIEDASNALRVYAIDRGFDLDEMVAESEARQGVARAIVCDIVRREMLSNTDTPAMSQISQTAGPYAVTGTYLSPGGGLFVKNQELKMLGLTRQKIKAVSYVAD